MTAFVVNLIAITVCSFSCGVYAFEREYTWATILLVLVLANILCACLNYKTREEKKQKGRTYEK